MTSRDPSVGSLPINIPTGLEYHGTGFYIPADSPLAVLLSAAASPTRLERDLLAEKVNKIVDIDVFDIQLLTPFLGIATSCSS
jgi:hypothetical protein